MAKFPPDWDPLAASLKAFAAAAPQSRPRIVREYATLEEALEAFRRRCNGEDDDDRDVVDVAGRA
jgi:hypothetical protein